MEDDKIKILSISIGKDETLREFGRRFVTDAQSLSAMCHITPRELASALLQAISPFPHLLVFQPLLYGPVTESQVFRVAETLSTHRMSQPAKQSHGRKAYHVEEHSEEEGIHFSRGERESTCHNCGQKGHWSRHCPTKPAYRKKEYKDPAVHHVDVVSEEEDSQKKD